MCTAAVKKKKIQLKLNVSYTQSTACVFANVKEFFSKHTSTMARPASLAALLLLLLFATTATAQKVLVLTDDTLADALSANEKILVEFYGSSLCLFCAPKFSLSSSAITRAALFLILTRPYAFVYDIFTVRSTAAPWCGHCKGACLLFA